MADGLASRRKIFSWRRCALGAVGIWRREVARASDACLHAPVFVALLAAGFLQQRTRASVVVDHRAAVGWIDAGIDAVLASRARHGGWLSPHAMDLQQRLVVEPKAEAVRVSQESPASPNSARETITEVFEAEPPANQRFPLSLRVDSTRHQVAMLVMAIVAYFLASQLLISDRIAWWAALLVLVNGSLYSLFGILQSLTWRGHFYWVGPSTSAGSPFAAYVNRNNAAGYLCICFAAGIMLLAWRSRQLAESQRRDREPPPRKRTANVIARMMPQINLSQLDPLAATLLALTAMVVAGIISSMSRGAMLATGVSLLVGLGASMAVRRVWQPAGMGAALVLGIGLVAWVGRLDMVSERFATLSQDET